MQATGNTEYTRENALYDLQYPTGVNPTYGLVSIEYMMNAFRSHDFNPVNVWVTYDQAYSIMREHTGVINPVGMYHFMGMRGTDYADIGTLWVANSAIGYRGISEEMNRSQFNSLGPVQLVYLD
jgi:hypothetical protein